MDESALLFLCRCGGRQRKRDELGLRRCEPPGADAPWLEKRRFETRRYGRCGRLPRPRRLALPERPARALPRWPLTRQRLEGTGRAARRHFAEVARANSRGPCKPRSPRNAKDEQN